MLSASTQNDECMRPSPVVLNKYHENDISMNASLAEKSSSSSNEDTIACNEDPFEGVLVWPRVNENTHGKKRRKQEHVPSVATSDRWLQWYNKKDSDKKQEELAKKDRIEKRKLIKQQKEEKKEEQRLEKIEKKRLRDEEKELRLANKENAKRAKTVKPSKRKQNSNDKNSKRFLKINIG
ncbi:glutamic acid-rich protein-like [Aedes albopictus]|uniref:Coiled-coil domain-containing protein 86 n=1 Tax=Aedes albopictus TaxID=7160 RepID=A0ABM1Y0N0_AEDAL